MKPAPARRIDPGGCHFAMADGSVHFVAETIDITVYRGLGAREDGLPVRGFLDQ